MRPGAASVSPFRPMLCVQPRWSCGCSVWCDLAIGRSKKLPQRASADRAAAEKRTCRWLLLSIDSTNRGDAAAAAAADDLTKKKKKKEAHRTDKTRERESDRSSGVTSTSRPPFVRVLFPRPLASAASAHLASPFGVLVGLRHRHRHRHALVVAHPQVEEGRQCDGAVAEAETWTPRRRHQGPHGRLRRGERGHRGRAARLQHG